MITGMGEVLVRLRGPSPVLWIRWSEVELNESEQGPGGHQSVVYRAACVGLGKLACCMPCVRLADSMWCVRLADSMQVPALFR